MPVRAASAPETLDPKSLVGRWYVIATTFPMWRDRCDVTFGYGVTGERTLSDQVSYVEDGKPDGIAGSDTQHADVPTHFTWRGEGLLALFKSDWDIVAVAEDGSWVVLAFGETLATPAGVDVISRHRTLDDDTLNAAVARAAIDSTIAPRTTGLYRVAACR